MRLWCPQLMECSLTREFTRMWSIQLQGHLQRQNLKMSTCSLACSSQETTPTVKLSQENNFRNSSCLICECKWMWKICASSWGLMSYFNTSLSLQSRCWRQSLSNHSEMPDWRWLSKCNMMAADIQPIHREDSSNRQVWVVLEWMKHQTSLCQILSCQFRRDMVATSMMTWQEMRACKALQQCRELTEKALVREIQSKWELVARTWGQHL